MSASTPADADFGEYVLAELFRPRDRCGLNLDQIELVPGPRTSRLGIEPTILDDPEPAINGNWYVELEAALPGLRSLQTAHAAALERAGFPVFAWPRCDAAIAALANVAAQYPDAVVVWFDAHADLNTPDNTTTGYLGGLALSTSLGW